jgi:nitrate reductase gamma subunit
MEIFHWFAWLIYPYTVAAVFGMGIVWQYGSPGIFQEIAPKMSQFLNWFVKSLWLLTTVTGIGLILFYRSTGDLSNMFEWLISLLHFRPEFELLKSASILTQVHLLLLFTFLLFISFTKYISFISKPCQFIKAITKKYVTR